MIFGLEALTVWLLVGLVIALTVFPFAD